MLATRPNRSAWVSLQLSPAPPGRCARARRTARRALDALDQGSRPEAPAAAHRDQPIAVLRPLELVDGLGDEKAAMRERSNTYLNLVSDEGVSLYRWWEDLHPGEPYPDF